MNTTTTYFAYAASAVLIALGVAVVVHMIFSAFGLFYMKRFDVYPTLVIGFMALTQVGLFLLIIWAAYFPIK